MPHHQHSIRQTLSLCSSMQFNPFNSYYNTLSHHFSWNIMPLRPPIAILFLLALLLPTALLLPSAAVHGLLSAGAPLQVRTYIRHNGTLLHGHTFPFTYQEEAPVTELPVELELPQQLADNVTIQVEVYALQTTPKGEEVQGVQKAKKGEEGVEKGRGEEMLLAKGERNLTRYQRVRREDEDEGSLVSHDPIDEIAAAGREKPNATDDKYALHIVREFDIMVIYCDMPFPASSVAKPEHRLTLVSRNGRTFYLPPLDLGQLYIPTTRSLPLPSSPAGSSTHTVTLRLFPRSYFSYLTFYSFGHVEEFRKGLGPLAEALDVREELMDEMKEFLFSNPTWLVVLYFVLSFGETVLKMAFVKSELAFWKNIASNRGISLKTLFFQLVADLVVSLYLYEYGANTLVIVFHVVDVAITVWKISRTYSLQLTGRFPFVGLRPSEAYLERAAYDSESIWYMNYLLVPLMAVYLVYSLNKRGWVVGNVYRFCLETAVAFIALFGFILMTPQLYMNYRLKSVDHMNWRGMVYRFITTVIDDLFAFMVTMPALRRVMYFRDDLIFLGYLYQRQIYQVDYSRKTLFTQGEDRPKQE